MWQVSLTILGSVYLGWLSQGSARSPSCYFPLRGRLFAACGSARQMSAFAFRIALASRIYVPQLTFSCVLLFSVYYFLFMHWFLNYHFRKLALPSLPPVVQS